MDVHDMLHQAVFYSSNVRILATELFVATVQYTYSG